LIPSWQDCDALQAVAAALKPLKEMTDALSAEKCPTISAIKPLLKHLTTVVLVDSEDDVELTKEIKEKIRMDMECRYALMLQLSCFFGSKIQVIIC